MPYQPEWLLLAHAPAHVAAATGQTDDEAKVDICNAIADRKIKVRVVAQKQEYVTGNVQPPRRLSPDDFDWNRSRPRATWWVGPLFGQHYYSTGKERQIDLVELLVADVDDILCREENKGVPQVVAKKKAIKALAAELAQRPQMKRDEAPVKENMLRTTIWPRARELAGLPAKAPPGARKKIG